MLTEGTIHRHNVFVYFNPSKANVTTNGNCIGGSLESCIQLTKNYVQTLVENFNSRFQNLIEQDDIAIATYEDLCHLQMHLQTPNMFS